MVIGALSGYHANRACRVWRVKSCTAAAMDYGLGMTQGCCPWAGHLSLLDIWSTFAQHSLTEPTEPLSTDMCPPFVVKPAPSIGVALGKHRHNVEPGSAEQHVSMVPCLLAD